jgi:3'-5' exonuclease/HEAT repeats
MLNDKVPQADPDTVLEQEQQGYLGITPQPGLPPEKGQRAWIDRPEQLLLAIDSLKTANVVAVDAEFTQIRSVVQTGVSTTSHRLALLQLAIDKHCFVVDALRLHDLSPLAAVVEDPSIVILLHGAGSDLRVMAERDLNVAHYFDLEATSRSIFGQHESSLAAMLQRALHVRLDKSLQRTDWTRRPLPPAMVAYAARDAEMTLALYYWLNEHYSWALKLHESTNLQEPVAAWIEPFLRGSSPMPAEVVVAEAIEQGTITNQEQLVVDCRAALTTITHPMRCNRLLRLIADLSLVELATEIEPLLTAKPAEVRAGAIRALSRLNVEQAKDLIRPLLHDPVQDVRKAAQTALRAQVNKEPHSNVASRVKSADGTRSWFVGDSNETDTSDENDWKARLRSMIDE